LPLFDTLQASLPQGMIGLVAHKVGDQEQLEER